MIQSYVVRGTYFYFLFDFDTIIYCEKYSNNRYSKYKHEKYSSEEIYAQRKTEELAPSLLNYSNKKKY